MNLREIHATDAAAYVQLLAQIERESPYALLEPEERRTTIQEQWDEIEQIRRSDNQMIWIVEDRDRLVAWLGAFGERYRRVSHNVLVGIGVLAPYRNQGLGTRLFSALEQWAWKHQIHRLELFVANENQAGIALYQKMGFQIEGTRRESYQIDGRYVDEYLMAKLLIPPEPPKKNLYSKW